MLGHFYFSPFGEHMLITNDAGKFAFLSKDEFNRFVAEKAPGDNDLLDKLTDAGFYSEKPMEAYIRDHCLAVREGNSYLFDTTNLFIIAVTNACNNRCVYCQANGNNKISQMTTKVAEQTLRRIAECPAEDITIEFQGGEPLLNYPVIQYFVTRSAELLQNKRVQFTVVSNLRFMTDQIAEFFEKYKVNVSTSLDGHKELHNANRPASDGQGTYEDVILMRKKLMEHHIFSGAIETTTRASLDYPERIVDTYVKEGFPMIFLRPLSRLGAAARRWNEIGYSAEEYLSFYSRALRHILKYNLQGYFFPEYGASLFLSKILQGKSPNYMELRSPCGAGTGQVAITANGNVYTCDEGRMIAEAGDEAFCIGNVFSTSYQDWISSPTCRGTSAASLLDSLPGCCDCVYKPYCGVCPVVNYALHGNTTHVSSERCKINKGILGILFELILEGDQKVISILSKWGESA